VIRTPETEKILKGKKLSPDLIQQAHASISNEISPITDLRSTEHYRRIVTANVLAKFLRAWI
jgi:xanthine dehydrogenase iron-sulfur cluster and FAD-binding subunit A